MTSHLNQFEHGLVGVQSGHMGELRYYQLIPPRRSEYSEAPTDVSEAAEAAYERAFDETTPLQQQ